MKKFSNFKILFLSLNYSRLDTSSNMLQISMICNLNEFTNIIAGDYTVMSFSLQVSNAEQAICV